MSTSMAVTQKIHVPARTGTGFAVAKGDLIRITDLEGHLWQSVD